jgi:cytochrome c6
MPVSSSTPWPLSLRSLGALLRSFLLVVVLLGCAVAPVRADGGALFEQHCAGCHVNGGNIIRRGKTLRMAALERQGLASPEAIATVIQAGIGQMSPYGSVLGDDGVQQVATWVWQQAELGWPKSS